MELANRVKESEYYTLIVGITILGTLLFSILLHEIGHIIMYEIIGLDWEIVITAEKIAVSPIINSIMAFDYFYGNMTMLSVFGGLFAGTITLPLMRLDIKFSFVSFYQIGAGLIEPMTNRLTSIGYLTTLDLVFVSIFVMVFAFGMMCTMILFRNKIMEIEIDE